MKTPIHSFVKDYINSGFSRFHMPGHKGAGKLGCEPYDITEIDGADVLYSASGIINESEENASSLFNTAHTFYSAEGSTLSIKAMLGLAVKNQPNGYILATRNVHKAFIYAAALLDIRVEWLYPKAFSHLCSCTVTPYEINEVLSKSDVRPSAVYVTSPDYLGNMLDIKGISEVCDKYEVPLLVDNAHGAYLAFLETSLHPIALGAQMCCDSAHKTLPVLTGGAYLHVSKKAPQYFTADARQLLSLFASTSPSYLILQSLDLCNEYLYASFRNELKLCISKAEKLKKSLTDKGVSIAESEPLKIVIKAFSIGYTGKELSEYLFSKKIAVEFYDTDYTVLMVSPQNTEADFLRLEEAFQTLTFKSPLHQKTLISPQKAESCLSVRQALLGLRETIPVDEATNRICASVTVSCPPAVPIIMSGERITENAVSLMREYGITHIEVTKEN